MAAMRLTVAELRSAGNATGQEFEAVVILRKCTTKTARNDNTYLSVEFGDKSGSFNANVFSDSPVSEIFHNSPEGSVLRIGGKIEFYQGRLSPRLSSATLMNEDELSKIGGLDALVETAPESGEELKEQLDALIARIGEESLRHTVELALESVGEAFLSAPAAISMHHAYQRGLLEHTVHVGQACVELLPLYPEVPPDLALAGALLHDIGKAEEYTGALAPRKTRIGQLQGHVVLGYRIVRKAGIQAKLNSDSLERLEHIILSHQGELEWGAATMAATPEAVFVSMVDNLDAKMGMVQRALRKGTDEDEFSEYLPGLKASLLRTPVATEDETDSDQEESQGSLPLE